MSTVKLSDYRITCNHREAKQQCQLAVVILQATDQEDAEERARRLGWRIGLSASCPTCEQVWQARRAQMMANVVKRGR
jgi:hypothetical protein